MATTVANPTVTRCKVHIARNDEWATLVLSLDGPFTGGKIVEPSIDFTSDIHGLDEITCDYQLSNWWAGVISGALYAFRALNLPRRRLQLHQLDGSLSASGMHAPAIGTTLGVAKLLEENAPILECNDWQIECDM